MDENPGNFDTDSLMKLSKQGCHNETFTPTASPTRPITIITASPTRPITIITVEPTPYNSSKTGSKDQKTEPPKSDSSQEAKSFDFKMILYIVLGIILFVVAGIFAKKFYDLKKMETQPRLRSSGSSSVYVEDDRYTVHSQSTLSTAASYLSSNASSSDRSKQLARQINNAYGINS
jgi:hypothetical protein